jgi:hypothetical protein
LSELKDYETPKALCPYCGYAVDRALEAQAGTQPRPGDLSLCMACSGLSIFSDALTLRMPTRSEIIAIRVSPSWKEIWKARAAMDRLPNRPKQPRHQ